VAAGPLKLVVAGDELRAATVEERAPVAKVAPKGGSSRDRPLEVAIPTRDNQCDLRGLRADDAVAMATTFLDRSLNEGRRVAFLVHGHGTGALRDAIRKELRESPYVAFFRGGESSEGGDGVTVVWLT
jgi:DNA mismatch repair protein MutS2